MDELFEVLEPLPLLENAISNESANPDMDLPTRVLLAVQRNPGSRGKEIAKGVETSRKDTNRVLHRALGGLVRKDKEHRWWPAGYEVDPELAEGHALLLRSLAESTTSPIRGGLGERPADVELGPPHLLYARFYLFKLKAPGPGGRRSYINITLPDQNGEGLVYFDRSGGFRPFLVGYDLDLQVFLLFDTEIYELGGGIKYNRFCYVDSRLPLQALREGVTTEVRTLRKPYADETVVACRSSLLNEALDARRSHTLNRLLAS
jgi:hypothetical protein